jgi:hypothetical protein
MILDNEIKMEDEMDNVVDEIEDDDELTCGYRFEYDSVPGVDADMSNIHTFSLFDSDNDFKGTVTIIPITVSCKGEKYVKYIVMYEAKYGPCCDNEIDFKFDLPCNISGRFRTLSPAEDVDIFLLNDEKEYKEYIDNLYKQAEKSGMRIVAED